MTLRSLTHRLLVFAAVLTCSSLLASAEVLKVVVDDKIHPITAEYITRALDDAAAHHDTAVLIELRTPGGLETSMRDIVSKMLASPVPVIVYVAPSGSRAASAGFVILEAADVAAMAPGTNTGAAHPVLLNGKMEDDMRKKVENDAAAFVRSFVGKRGRNVELAESAVRESKSWTDQEALTNHLIDYVATSDQDLLKQLDGKTITRFDGSKVTLHLAGEQERSMPMSLRQQIMAWLMDPNVLVILLSVGMLALYAEFNHPGAVIPGVVGLIFILLAVFAMNLLPTRYAALALILASFVLFALEAKFQTHGVLAIGGVAALTIGALLLVDGPIPEMRVHLLTALAISIPLGAITVFLMTIAIKARRSKVLTGAQGLIGEVGVAQSPLAPEGKVFIQGELWNAVSKVEIASGEQVVVRRLNGLTLEVEPAKAHAPVSSLSSAG